MDTLFYCYMSRILSKGSELHRHRRHFHRQQQQQQQQGGGVNSKDGGGENKMNHESSFVSDDEEEARRMMTSSSPREMTRDDLYSAPIDMQAHVLQEKMYTALRQLKHQQHHHYEIGEETKHSNGEYPTIPSTSNEATSHNNN